VASTGIYTHVSGDSVGSHSVKLIGWGTDRKDGDYWLVGWWSELWLLIACALRKHLHGRQLWFLFGMR
jgi:hypothetical protein